MATIETQETDSSRARRYGQAALLLRKWMVEDSDYDEQVGTRLDQELGNDIMQCRDDDEPTS